MPEGPEVYILCLALKKYGINCKSYGKHLYISNIKEDWSFGLNGKVKIDEKGNLNKLDKSKSINNNNHIQQPNYKSITLKRFARTP